jgi:hypothetical protein
MGEGPLLAAATWVASRGPVVASAGAGAVTSLASAGKPVPLAARVIHIATSEGFE